MSTESAPKFAVFVDDGHAGAQVCPWLDSHERAAQWTELHTNVGMPGQPNGYMVVRIGDVRYREVSE